MHPVALKTTTRMRSSVKLPLGLLFTVDADHLLSWIARTGASDGLAMAPGVVFEGDVDNLQPRYRVHFMILDMVFVALGRDNSKLAIGRRWMLDGEGEIRYLAGVASAFDPNPKPRQRALYF